MNENIEPLRVRLLITPTEILKLLPGMGKVMVIGQQGGVTHERIGPVGTVGQSGRDMHLGGACHDAVIAVDAVAEVILDTSSVMRDKVYPRLEFRLADGETGFAIVGMDGLEPFAAPLVDLDRETLPPREKPEVGERTELDPADPLHPPLQQAVDRQDMVRIRFDNGVLRQDWTGRIEALKPAMGYLNVMTADFHLHLQGGAFSGWDARAGHQAALDADGAATTLTLETMVTA
ncbi:hypothetical protein [Paracoccus aestuariivivens]|uniref:Haemin-degrading HemS/ChuX domain-containing protein n=1 Tax=Paracoccus aestuariivivens TaxID=1820333 RepID=A0A6L6JCM1_9RHOB|nr:hypothetical protein [Paracoccus aestuariivivens]MTH78397.1 hypothetical protein [Paracoccus aestuariivivens]